MNAFAAALIVGGNSTRMGSDKAHLPWRGIPLWRHQLITLTSMEPEDILICCGQRTDFSVPNARVIPDELPNRGPIAGVSAALAAATHEQILVLAVDLPEMTAKYLSGLLAATTPERGIVGARDGFYEPLAAVYPRRAAALAAEVAVDPDHSMQHFVRRAVAADLLAVRPITRPEEIFFRNVNTPEAGSPMP